MNISKRNYEVADKIGTLRAAISELQSELKACETIAKENGDGIIEGELYRITITTSERNSVQWRAIAEKLGATTRMITAYTTVSETTRLTCGARLSNEAA